MFSHWLAGLIFDGEWAWKMAALRIYVSPLLPPAILRWHKDEEVEEA